MAQFDNTTPEPGPLQSPAGVPVVSQQISFSTADVERGLFNTPKHVPAGYSSVVIVVLGNSLMAGGPLVYPPTIRPSEK